MGLKRFDEENGVKKEFLMKQFVTLAGLKARLDVVWQDLQLLTAVTLARLIVARQLRAETFEKNDFMVVSRAVTRYIG